jgi:hypothetical protein
MKISCSLLLVAFLCVPTFLGCGGGNEPQAPTGDELSGFLDANPDIAAEEENMGGIDDE